MMSWCHALHGDSSNIKEEKIYTCPITHLRSNKIYIHKAVPPTIESHSQLKIVTSIVTTLVPSDCGTPSPIASRAVLTVTALTGH